MSETNPGNWKWKVFGIGPRGAVISLMFSILALWIDRISGHPAITANSGRMRLIGAVLAMLGIGLLLWSIRTLRSWWEKDTLCTGGPFRWFRHPVYAAWITFLLPAAAFLMNSWIMLSAAVVLHPIWHRLVVKEEDMMRQTFGEAYRAYASRTGRFLPRIGRR